MVPVVIVDDDDVIVRPLDDLVDKSRTNKLGSNYIF